MPSKKKKYYNARFPAGRIKKIMQTDEEVGKVAQAVPVIISRTLELFVESLLKKAADITTSKNAKTLTPSHMKQCILSESRFDFLADLVKNIPDSVNEEEPHSIETNSSSSSMNRRRTSIETSSSSHLNSKISSPAPSSSLFQQSSYEPFFNDNQQPSSSSSSSSSAPSNHLSQTVTRPIVENSLQNLQQQAHTQFQPNYHLNFHQPNQSHFNSNDQNQSNHSGSSTIQNYEPNNIQSTEITSNQIQSTAQMYNTSSIQSQSSQSISSGPSVEPSTSEPTGFHFNFLPAPTSSSATSSSSSSNSFNSMVPTYSTCNNFSSPNLVIDEDYDN